MPEPPGGGGPLPGPPLRPLCVPAGRAGHGPKGGVLRAARVPARLRPPDGGRPPPVPGEGPLPPGTLS